MAFLINNYNEYRGYFILNESLGNYFNQRFGYFSFYKNSSAIYNRSVFFQDISFETSENKYKYVEDIMRKHILNTSNFTAIFSFEDAKNIIENLPTVDGKWVNDYEFKIGNDFKYYIVEF